jgi:drug/metabolite transporter (DMT)-like permease
MRYYPPILILDQFAPAMTKRHSHLDLGAMLIMIACCACWGLNLVAVKIANAGISPILQAGLRGAGASLLLLLWSAARGIPLLERDGSLWWGAVLGLIFAAEFVFLYCGVTLTTASSAIVFMYLAPFVVAIGAHLLIPGERLGWAQAIGLGAAFAGMLVAFADALRLPTGDELIGDLMVVVAAILWGATTIVVKTTRLVTISATKTLLYQLGASAILLPPLSLALGEPGFSHPTPMALLALAYSTVGVAFATYLAWYWLILRYPASKLSGFSFLAPLLGVLAGGLLLGEPITEALWAALVLVALGIYLINRRPRVAAIGVAPPRREAA